MRTETRTLLEESVDKEAPPDVCSRLGRHNMAKRAWVKNGSRKRHHRVCRDADIERHLW
ncbi:MAG: hypothetical protein KDA37_06445 [Planctomycetales bacterium]|nr:hypothetical protein [Planctomycetales bacterium]